MTTQIHPAATGALRPPSTALAEAPAALRRAARRIVAWLETRERFAADRDALARMSDRELLDIGLDRTRANAIAGDVDDPRRVACRMR